jgi:hypothetical protein
VDFEPAQGQNSLRQRCPGLAADFATRSSEHNRDASHLTEGTVNLTDRGPVCTENGEHDVIMTPSGQTSPLARP